MSLNEEIKAQVKTAEAEPIKNLAQVGEGFER